MLGKVVAHTFNEGISYLVPLKSKPKEVISFSQRVLYQRILLEKCSTTFKGLLYISRNIFEQAIHLKISAKKMKALFKRYLEFEKQHGNQARMDAVIEKARTFVESNRSQTD